MYDGLVAVWPVVAVVAEAVAVPVVGAAPAAAGVIAVWAPGGAVVAAAAGVLGVVEETIVVGGGGPMLHYADNEVPVGLIDGVNTVFTLAHLPSGGIALYRNGVQQRPGGEDYTLVGTTITMTLAPLAGDTLIATYRYE